MKSDIASVALHVLLGFDCPPILRRGLGHVLGFPALTDLYERVRGSVLPTSVLRELNVTVASRGLAENLPRTGPAVLLANHPCGLLDGAVLLSLCAEVRTDVRIIANRILTAIPELSDTVIPVDVLTGTGVSGNAAAIRRAVRHVSEGGLLIVFPAGEVSGGGADAAWNPLVVRMLTAIARSRSGLRLVPAFVSGSNSRLFRAARGDLRTALLTRELLNKQGRTVQVNIGKALGYDRLLAMQTDEERIEFLRWRSELLRRESTPKPGTRLRVPGRTIRTKHVADLSSAEPAASMKEEVLALPEESLMASSGDLRVYLAAADQIPHALREIGRLREITFRAAGEGTGRPRDLDEFDSHYLHLFAWNAARTEIAGAYRIARVDQVRERFGIAGLYTATLFSFGDEFLDQLGPALELGRSFVRQEYQRSFAALLLLWKGIGRLVARHPQYKTLFGPVSISDSYSALSRELMVAWLERRSLLSEMTRFVKSRNPFRVRMHDIPASVQLDDLSDVISDIEQSRTGVPVLLRQYLKLGGRLVGFNVDRQFADAIDGLIVVDLTKTEPKLVERYLGQAEAQTFLTYQRGGNGSIQDDLYSELDAADHRRRNPAPDTILQVQRRPRVGLHLLHAWRRAVGQDR